MSLKPCGQETNYPTSRPQLYLSDVCYNPNILTWLKVSQPTVPAITVLSLLLTNYGPVNSSLLIRHPVISFQYEAGCSNSHHGDIICRCFPNSNPIQSRTSPFYKLLCLLNFCSDAKIQNGYRSVRWIYACQEEHVVQTCPTLSSSPSSSSYIYFTTLAWVGGVDRELHLVAYVLFAVDMWPFILTTTWIGGTQPWSMWILGANITGGVGVGDNKIDN